MADETYNPLDKLRLGESVAKALLARPISVLPPSGTFIGAGIYALYYRDSFPPYRKVGERNAEDKWACPIYVGKAVPPGTRKGGYGLGDSPGEVLYRRLREHAESIGQAENLSLADFKCRYLIVDAGFPLVNHSLSRCSHRSGINCSTASAIMTPERAVTTSNGLPGT